MNIEKQKNALTQRLPCTERITDIEQKKETERGGKDKGKMRKKIRKWATPDPQDDMRSCAHSNTDQLCSKSLKIKDDLFGQVRGVPEQQQRGRGGGREAAGGSAGLCPRQRRSLRQQPS